jgi:Recombination endonuclease VII
MKTCTKCGVEKELTDFYRQHSKSGYRAACKECVLAHGREKDKAGSDELKAKSAKQRHSWNDPEKWSIRQKIARKSHLKRNYGMSLEEFQHRLDEQNSCCAICGIHIQDATHKQLVVDHCHTTGKVRGLLCDLCNTALGKFKDNKEVLKQAIKYLDDNS